MAGAFYVRDGDRYVSTELTRGPWDPTTQHGGPPAALFAHALQRFADPGDLQIARVTVEFLRPVPIAPLEVHVETLRSGRHVDTVEGRIVAGGREVARARALRIRTRDVRLPQPTTAPPPPGPASRDSYDTSFFPTGSDVGYHTGMEYRFVKGAFTELGPATVWMRARHPLVEGEETAPWERVLIAADSGNGVSAAVDYGRYLFINPDLTVHLHRQPLGEWVCLDARTVIEPSGVGLATSTVFDEHGAIGHGLQSLYVAERS